MDNLKGEKMEMEFPGMEEECEGAGRSDMSTGTPQVEMLKRLHT